MPSLIKTIIRRGNTVKRALPIKSNVTLYGIKRPDTAEFEYTTQVDIRHDDEISYIQDVVDTTYLRAIWNFQLSTKDEGGYNFDPTIELPETRFEPLVTDGNLRTHGTYSLKFNAANQQVVIPRTHPNFTDELDFSKQFDIYIWLTPDNIQPSSPGSPVIFTTRSEGNTGIEIGLDEFDGRLKPYVINTGANTLIGNIAFDNTNSPQPTLLRVWRDSQNMMHIAVNGEEDYGRPSNSLPVENTNNLNSNDNISFGGATRGTNDFNGLIHQIRIYCGSYLTEKESLLVYGSKFTPTTMKFGGTVVSIKDESTHKKVTCRSWGATLFSKLLNEQLYNSLPNNNALRMNNVYEPTNILRPVIEDMIRAVDSTLTLRVPTDNNNIDTLNTTGGLQPEQAEIVGVGRCSDILGILLQIVEIPRIFTVTARKIVLIDNAVGIDTSHTFNHNASRGHKYDVVGSEQRVFKNISSLLIIGYDDTEAYTSDMSVEERRATVLKLPFLTGQAVLTRLVGSIVRQQNDRVTRYEVNSPALTNHIRPFMNVDVIIEDSKKSTDRVGGIISLPISEILYKYPEGKTIIQVGSNSIDYYDYQVENEFQLRSETDFPDRTVTTVVTQPPVEMPEPNMPPTIEITSPTNNLNVNEGTNIVFSVNVVDPDGEALGGGVTWTSSRDDILGTGAAISRSDLSVGTHTITATVVDGEFTRTDSVMITIIRVVPDQVTGLSATIDGLTVDLDWNSVSRADSYRVYRSADNVNFEQIAERVGTVHRDNLNVGQAGTTLYYNVRAGNSDNVFGDPSNSVSVTVDRLPSRPSDFDIFDRNFEVGGIVLRIEIESDEEDITSSDFIDVTRQAPSESTYSDFETFINANNDHRNQLPNNFGFFPNKASDPRIYLVETGLTLDQVYRYRAYRRNHIGRGMSFRSQSSQPQD